VTARAPALFFFFLVRSSLPPQHDRFAIQEKRRKKKKWAPTLLARLLSQPVLRHYHCHHCRHHVPLEDPLRGLPMRPFTSLVGLVLVVVVVALLLFVVNALVPLLPNGHCMVSRRSMTVAGSLSRLLGYQVAFASLRGAFLLSALVRLLLWLLLLLLLFLLLLM